jgi:hypothetical protein
MTVSKRPSAKQPSQTTRKGAEIPVPTRSDFMRDLRKVSRPITKPPRSDEAKDQT